MIETQPKFALSFDEDNKIFRCAIIGDQTEEDAKEMFEEIWLLIDRVVKEGGKVEKIDVLNDVSQAGKVNKKVKEIHATFFKNIKVNKVAIIGANAIRRTIVSFIYSLAGFKNVKFFNNEDKAVAWLKEW